MSSKRRRYQGPSIDEALRVARARVADIEREHKLLEEMLNQHILTAISRARGRLANPELEYTPYHIQRFIHFGPIPPHIRARLIRQYRHSYTPLLRYDTDMDRWTAMINEYDWGYNEDVGVYVSNISEGERYTQ